MRWFGGRACRCHVGWPDGGEMSEIGGHDVGQHAAEGSRELLKEHGLRYSRAREAILEFFKRASRHVSAEGLYLALKEQDEDVSLSTVYLNLNVLTQAGLIREFRGVNGETIYDGNVTPHHHLICKETGEVRDIPLIEIDGVPLGRYVKELVESQTGWRVDEPVISLEGVRPADQGAVDNGE